MAHRSEADRIAVIALRHDGLSPAAIKRRTGFSREFIRRWISAADQRRSASDRPRSGRPPKLTPPVVRMVRAHMKGRLGRSCRKVAKIMQARHNIKLGHVSVRTAARRAG